MCATCAWPATARNLTASCVIGALAMGGAALLVAGLDRTTTTILAIAGFTLVAALIFAGMSGSALADVCGIGMMEVERPWLESTSAYTLQENMMFQVDTFFQGEDFGLRWENGVRVTKTGVERLSKKFQRMVEL